MGRKPRFGKGVAGRPFAGHGKDVRHQLLKASQQLFAGRGYQGVSIKAIADKAGVNTAMVHYYFGNKDSLFVAVIEETMQPILSKARELATVTDTEAFIRQFLQIYMKTIAANPWLPVLLAREVILPEGRLKDRFISQVVGPLSNKVRKLIETSRKHGDLDPETDPAVATINLASLAFFPFLAMPVLSKALKIDVDDNFVEKLTRHTTQLYLKGLYNPGTEK
jgi:AcrR family transcriptional regulator